MDKLVKNRNILIFSNSNTYKSLLSNYFDNEKFIDEKITFSLFNYRKINIDGDTNYLLNSPGNTDFKSIEQVLGGNVDGIIIFMDTSGGVEDTDFEVMGLIKKEKIPQILMANRNDLDDIEMNISLEGILVVPTILKEEIGVDSCIRMLLKMIDKKDEGIMNENTINHTHTKTERKNTEFYKVRLFFHPIELDSVKKSLAQFGFSNLTIIDIKYQDPQIEKTETYRCSSYEMKLPSKTEMVMIIKKEDIKYIVQAIEAVKTEDISEKIFLSPIDDVIRIRTTERGEKAVD